MAKPASKLKKHQPALRRLGERVRQRLADNPAVYRVPTDDAEVWMVGGFLTGAQCKKLRDMIDGVARPSPIDEAYHDKVYRTSYSGDIDPDDPFVRNVARRIDDLIGIDGSFGEPIQGQRYMPGQEFKAHVDWFGPEYPHFDLEMRHGGQRSITTMAFLNEVEAGGTTDFVNLGLSIQPTPGVLLLWNNADRDGVPSQATRHAGTPVEQGTKYIFTRWYRSQPWG